MVGLDFLKVIMNLIKSIKIIKAFCYVSVAVGLATVLINKEVILHER
jgi:UDP-N-acetylglucosamine:LPS N-acetylglucosamine transferase